MRLSALIAELQRLKNHLACAPGATETADPDVMIQSGGIMGENVPNATICRYIQLVTSVEEQPTITLKSDDP